MTDNRYEEPVGYKRPPKHTQFKPGQSGNRKGRPRGSKSRKAIIRDIAYEMHDVREGNETRRLSTIEMVLLAVRNQALKGNTRAVRALNGLMAKYEAEDPNQRVGYLIIPESGTDDEVEQEIAERQKKWREKSSAPQA